MGACGLVALIPQQYGGAYLGVVHVVNGVLAYRRGGRISNKSMSHLGFIKWTLDLVPGEQNLIECQLHVAC